MTINKFQGKTKEEALQKAKDEFGENAVIMNVKEIKPKGLFRVFKSSVFEVTAAMEEKETFISPKNILQPTLMTHEKINITADEEIKMPKLQNVIKEPETKNSVFEEKNIEERLDNLSNMLEESLGNVRKDSVGQKDNPSTEEINFLKILYSTLLKNEVNEKYINQIMDEIEKMTRPGNNVDTILSNVYQKMILRFGQPKPIELDTSKPKVVIFMGPTGVGKTTSIAKIASKYKMEYDRKVAFITADTYRIAATEQLKIYANILNAPMSIVYSAEELNPTIQKFEEYDLIFVDTAGFSHKNNAQKEDMKKLLDVLDPIYAKEVYLVLSATTKYNDLLDIVDMYRELSEYKLLFTKLDETTCYGNLLNIKLYSKADLSYVTNGQNVPEDIEIFNTQKIVKHLLGGR